MTKQILLALGVVATSASLLAAPSVTRVTFSQEDTGPRTVTVNYTLAGEAAIITMDVLTNNVSIGDANIHFLEGDVNRLVQTGDRQFRWFAQKSWPGHNITTADVKIRVKAWARSSPPDYMVVDLETPNDVRYYTSTNALPDGGLENLLYKTSRLVMRYVEAAGETYTMGWPGGTGQLAEHSATLSKNFYIGIYTITQAQWKRITGWYPSYNHNPGAIERMSYPVQYTAYNEIREVAPVDDNVPINKSYGQNGQKDVVGDATYAYPAAPAPTSFLGLLSSHAGIAFDLPSECEWEYACRAGNYGAKWGDGTPYLGGTTDSNLSRIGRYSANSSSHIWPVGSLAPNSWGIYDMHGNLWEWCVDFFNTNISSLNGAVDTRTNGVKRTERGGGYHKNPDGCTSGYRTSDLGNTRYEKVGFRVVSRVD